MRVQTNATAALACAALWFGVGGQASADAGAFDAQMQKVLAPYLVVQAALASDSVEGVQKQAARIAKEAKRLRTAGVTGEHAEHYRELPAKLASAAAELAKATTLKQARDAFKELSRPMATWASRAKPKGVHVVFCSMAKASWLQKGEDVRNPYYGKSMLACGEIVDGDTAR